MEKIRVEIQWCGHNFGATLSDNVPGAIALTAKTYQELMKAIPETLQFHVEGAYDFEYHLDTAALIRSCEQYASLAAISRASGVNARLLSHYANGLKKPRPAQRQRIVEGLHKIGRHLMSVV